MKRHSRSMKGLTERFPFFCNSIIRASLEKGYPLKALQDCKFLFHLGILRPDHRTLALMLKACSKSRSLRTMQEAHSRVIKLGLLSHEPLFSCLFQLYLIQEFITEAENLFDEMPKRNLAPVYGNLMIKGLLKNNQYEKTCKVFKKMPLKDLVSWNSMIGGCVKSSRPHEALILFRRMLSSGFEPDGFTFSSVLSACARVGALIHGEWVHRLMADKRAELNHILGSALIDMYAKCGRIEVARRVFDEIPRGNASVWNSMITGLAIHGLGRDVLDVFSRMGDEGIAPDAITFVGVLTACSHCGFVQEARRCFKEMTKRHSVEPLIEHYGAMVDTLARAGHLDEAYDTIKAMPMEADIVIWRALLSACRMHRRPDLGEAVIQRMGKKQSGDYVLLSSIYSSEKRYKNAEQVWWLMKEHGVRKNRGLSWVEMNGKVHQFKAGDRSHCETEAIYGILGVLMKKVKAEGFLAATELVTMDVSEEEKEENLHCHSEKLAVAYGVLKTGPEIDIRVSKNLRTCLDCHDWMKMVSKVLHRVILVRDRVRFHRFERGSCSCNDYW